MNIAETVKKQTDRILRQRTLNGTEGVIIGGVGGTGSPPPTVSNPSADLAAHKTSNDHDAQYFSLARISDVKEFLVTDTVKTTIVTRTPDAVVNALIGITFRVAVATTDITLVVTYRDVAGAQTNTLLYAQSCAVGSYSTPMMLINSVANEPMSVDITAGTANQVYVSASILEVS